MPQLIKDGSVVDNTWTMIAADESLESAELNGNSALLSLQAWQALDDAQKASIGVWLSSEQLADDLGDECQKAPVIAIQFPTFMDGRGFSTARLLRERYGFNGELRAVNVIRDQLFYLQRCGFNSFVLADDQNLESALSSLSDFSDSYQPGVDQPLPLFRRRG